MQPKEMAGVEGLEPPTLGLDNLSPNRGVCLNLRRASQLGQYTLTPSAFGVWASRPSA